jgi:large-conductance mechanosensitive channel
MGEAEAPFLRGVVRPVECIRAGWDLVKDNYWLILGITLVGNLIAAAVPFGILAGPMMCGIYYCLIRKQRGRPIKFEMLFKGFDHFVQSLIATLIMLVPLLVILIPGYIVVIAILFATMRPAPGGGPAPPPSPAPFLIAYGAFMLLVILVSIVVAVLFFFVYPLIIDRKLSGVQAVKTSFKAAMGNLGGVLGLVLLNFVLTFVGLLACYVGAFFVMPIHFGAIAVAYRQVFPDEHVEPPKPTPEELDYDDQPDLEARPRDQRDDNL